MSARAFAMVGGPAAIGKEVVIADAGEALRDHVQEEATKELHD